MQQRSFECNLIQRHFIVLHIYTDFNPTLSPAVHLCDPLQLHRSCGLALRLSFTGSQHPVTMLQLRPSPIPTNALGRVCRAAYPSPIRRLVDRSTFRTYTSTPWRAAVLWQGLRSSMTSWGRRPAAVTSTLEVREQVRGMKVRSSVKKLCDGCKVCLYSYWPYQLGASWMCFHCVFYSTHRWCLAACL